MDERPLDRWADHGRSAPEEIGRTEFERVWNPTFAADITTQRVAVPPFLFAPIFRSQTLTVISAEPFTGKTLLMLAMMLSIDTGKPLLETFVPEPGHRSLFLGQDAPTWDYHTLFLKLFYGLGLSSDEERTIDLPSLLMLNRGLSLVSREFVPFVKTIISIYGISVIFLDTLLDFHPYEENSNREMGNVVGVLKRLREELGLTVIFSHHLSKVSPAEVSRNYRLRGASVLAGSIDHHFLLSSSSAPERVSFDIAKGRGLSLRDSPVPTFEIDQAVVNDRETIRLVPAEQSLIDQVARYLSVERDRSEIESFIQTLEPGASLQKARNRCSRVLTALEASNRIQSIERGRWIKRIIQQS